MPDVSQVISLVWRSTIYNKVWMINHIGSALDVQLGKNSIIVTAHLDRAAQTSPSTTGLDVSWRWSRMGPVSSLAQRR